MNNYSYDPDTIRHLLLNLFQHQLVFISHLNHIGKVRELTKKYNIVMIADEVITGFGRLGEWFGTMVWDVMPDITTTAKALQVDTSLWVQLLLQKK